MKTVVLVAGILLSFPVTAWAQTPSPAQDGSCGLAIINGEKVHPSLECRLPPPIAQNPGSLANTPQVEQREIDRLYNSLMRESAPSAEPSLDGSSTARQLPRPGAGRE